LSFILLASVFTIVIAKENQTNNNGEGLSTNVVSQENDTNNIEDKNIENMGTDNVEIINERQIPNNESDGLKNLTSSEIKAFFRLTRVTTGLGFVIKDDKSDAQFFRGTWIVRKSVEKPKNTESINNTNIKTRRFGFVTIGVREEKETFRMSVENATEEKIIFKLLNKEGNIAGNLELTPKRYKRITLWFGTLTINSGNYTGEWSVTASARTKIIKSKIERPSRWNIFAFGERRKAALEDKIQERMFEKEGMKKFGESIRGKRLSEISKDKRIAVINRANKRINKEISKEKRILKDRKILKNKRILKERELNHNNINDSLQ